MMLVITDTEGNERISDPSDMASFHEAGFTASCLSVVQAALAPEVHPDFDGENCVACGNELPQKRLEMGRVRCTSCQEKIEKRSRLYAH